ncbi:shikimate kinase [Zobellia barbeyronii]|uniref:gluconokinase n=1 Tax=Zobellia barbeyronii TaxID=2748009 RepID=A0ABS5WGK9_9FLAO|nr:gluconokinase [Zobellia barbeyronii]MBT2162275.1 gluconokinase [Zobellia barbeyronii]
MSKKDNFIVVLVGVCGTGKSVVGEKVAKKLDIPFFDADALFNEQLIADKENTNTESNTWLPAITSLISEQFNKDGCVVSCSILKKEQRLELAKNLDLNIDWVFMNGTYDEVNQRLDKGHSNNQTESSLESDFELLEIPKRALTVDITHPEQEIVDTILKYLARKYG